MKKQKKWRKPTGTSKSKKARMTYSTDKGVRGWMKNQERFEDACKEKKNGNAGHVYVFSLGYDKLYKIGCSYDVERRLADLKASNPRLMCVWSGWSPDMRELESVLHKRYKRLRVEREIFKLDTKRHIPQINKIANKFREDNS